MKKRVLQSIIFFLAINTLWSQPFRTPTFTGNAFSDFNAIERSPVMGDLAYEMTWDANNLYLGVSAVSNYAKNQPTIVYIDTDPNDSPTAGTGSTTGQNYDGRIGTLPFTANVVVYMKAGYAEMRVFQAGSWSVYYNVSGNIVTGTNDIEIFLPWSNFGGRPAAMRYLTFKQNGSFGTDAYNIFPNGSAAIAGGSPGSYIGNVNTNPFQPSQYIYIASTNSGAHTVNTSTSDCPQFALTGTACLPLTLTTSQNTGNNSYNITLNNATTAQNFVYSVSNTGATATSYTTNFAFQPSSTTPLPAGTYTVGSVTLGTLASSGASPLSCPNSFAGTGSVVVTSAAPTPTTATPTGATSGANGSIAIAGLTTGTTYNVSYQLNGAAATTVSGLVATGGVVTMLSLAPGTYTNIIVSNAATTCGALTALGPVTVTTTAPPAPSVTPSTLNLCINGAATINPTGITSGPLATDLFFSEYHEPNGGVCKYIEIFNGTGAPVSLSSYRVQAYFNGATTPANTQTLSGSLANNDVYTIVNSTCGTPSILAAADLTVNGGITNFNGNDAIVLQKNSVDLDIIGIIGNDPGAAGWAVAGTAGVTADRVLIRKASVISPTTNWAVSAGTTVANSQWTVSAALTSTMPTNAANINTHSFGTSAVANPFKFYSAAALGAGNLITQSTNLPINSSSTPSTATAGMSSVWVTQVDGFGNESVPTKVDVNVNPNPIANNTSLSSCPNTAAGTTATFTLSAANTAVTAGNTSGVATTYHANLANANNGTGIITTSTSPNGTVVYARVENIATGCFTISQVTLNVTPMPVTALCKNSSVLVNTATVTVPATAINNLSTGCNLSYSLTPNTFSCADIGNKIVTLTVTDGYGLTSSCMATVAVQDGAFCNTSITASISDPCVCKDNATNLANGQFTELVEVAGSAGMTFRVKAVSGLYLSTAPAAMTPAQQAINLIPIGTILTIKPGFTNRYILPAIHIDSIGYSVTVERLDAMLNPIAGSDLTISNKCYYPTPIFVGLNSTYTANDAAFTLNATEKNGGVVTNTFLIDGVVKTTFDPAALGCGLHIVRVNMDGAAYTPASGQNPPLSDPGCVQPIEKIVNITGTAAGGSLVCKDKLDVSLDPTTCTALVKSQDALATPFCGALTTILNGTKDLNTSVADVSMIGKTLIFKVYDSTNGNSCWGNLLVEDKTAPKFSNCPNTIVKECYETAALNVSSTEVFSPATSILIASGGVSASDCQAYTLSYTDEVNNTNCGGLYRSVITRNFKAVDNSGNVAKCAVTINVKRLNFAAATLFASMKKFNCDEPFAKNADGYPSEKIPAIAPVLIIGAVNVPISDACDVFSAYTDTKLPACGGGYELVRQWVVVDNCTNAVKNFTQIMAVVDMTAPAFGVPPSDVTISTSTQNCFSEGELNVPYATDNCDKNIKFSTAVIPVGGVDAISFPVIAGKTLVKGLPMGDYIITWTATDACGNSATATQKLTVADLIAPVAVCDLNTKVALTQDCKAIVNAISFDNGSIDNCCLDVNTFEVARMGGIFAPTIEFVRADCAAPVMILMRVSDCNKNKNTCMINVTVEDKIVPVAFGRDTVVCCGSTPSASAWLNAYILPKKVLIDYPNVNNPGYYENCGAAATREQSGSIDNCGNGTVTHKWTIKDDKSGATATANVNYISENRSAYTVKFPADVTLTCSSNKTYLTDPQGVVNVDNTTLPGNPVITPFTGTCPLVGVEYKDEIFKVVPDACFKIVRTWKILNWCQKMSPNLSAAAGTGALRKVRVTPGSCLGAVEQTRTFTNIDVLRPDGVTSVTAAGSPCRQTMIDLLDAEACYSFDTDGYMEYKQVIKVIDLTPPSITAGTVTTAPVGKECKTLLTIEKPTSTDCTGKTTDSYDIVNALTNVTIATGTVFPGTREFTEAEFGNYIVRYKTSDNCGNFNSTDVAVKVTDVKRPTALCFQGLAVDLMTDGKAMVNAKQFDAGSYDNCGGITSYMIQVPGPGLNAKYDPTKVQAIGIFDCLGFKNVGLWVSDKYGNWDYCQTYIDVQNNLKVPNVPLCPPSNTSASPKIAAYVKTESGNSVNADVTTIVNGALPGIKKLTSQGVSLFIVPTGSNVKVTAENDSSPLNGVSTLDLVLMSKHILGVQPITSPYQLIAGDVNNNGTISTADIVELRKLILGIIPTFTKNTSWRFFDQNMSEVIDIQNLSTDVIINFTAVKIGDINGNALTTAPRFQQTATFNIEDKNLKAGEISEILIDNANVEGFQFSLNYDKNALEIIEIDENSAMRTNGVINTAQVKSAMRFVVKAKKDVQLSKAISLGNQLATEAVINGKPANIALAFTSQSAALELFQNRPNPFNDATVISFNLPQSGSAKLTLSNATGRVVKVIENDFNKGYNEINISKKDLGTSGVLYYRLESDSQSITKKMIVIE
jgi:Lamin Tail Domain/Secretion system C-terminal sorting domain